MIFKIKKTFICSFCGEKKSEGMRFKSGCGICDECNTKIERAPKTGAFEGSDHLKYVIAPLFYMGLTRDAIMRYKFEGWSGSGDVFGYIMREFVSGFEHLKDFDAVIPVPISKERFNERGFNQSQPIAAAAADTLKLPCDTNTLRKIKHTKRQSSLSEKERIRNVHGAYSSASAKGKRIILVDDIYTTGATLEECARTLMNEGAAEAVGLVLSIKYRKEKNIFKRY